MKLRQHMQVDYLRQLDLIPLENLKKSKVTLIGAGSVGSFAALALGKMGVGEMTVYDGDDVDTHNIPNQFFDLSSVFKSKVQALRTVIKSFTEMKILPNKKFYIEQPLSKIVVVATDSMASRKLVWEQFMKQKSAEILIEARMGAQLGIVHTIRKKNGKVSVRDKRFYEKTLYSDDKVRQPKCTAKTIIYNVLMISSLICRAFKAAITKERSFPRKLVFNFTALDERSYMFTK